MTFRHRAGVSPYTSPFGFAETCVFVKQSPGPFHCDHLAVAPLLPLALGSSPHLPVSVCGTGTLSIPHTFSRHISDMLPYYNFSPFRPGLPTPGFRFHYMSVCLNWDGYGISTVCASTTPFGLALAPGLPGADEPTPENLRFSAITILTQFSLLIPAFSLEYSPHVLPVMLHPVFDAPLPIP